MAQQQPTFEEEYNRLLGELGCCESIINQNADESSVRDAAAKKLTCLSTILNLTRDHGKTETANETHGMLMRHLEWYRDLVPPHNASSSGGTGNRVMNVNAVTPDQVNDRKVIQKFGQVCDRVEECNIMSAPRPDIADNSKWARQQIGTISITEGYANDGGGSRTPSNDPSKKFLPQPRVVFHFPDGDKSMLYDDLLRKALVGGTYALEAWDGRNANICDGATWRVDNEDGGYDNIEVVFAFSKPDAVSAVFIDKDRGSSPAPALKPSGRNRYRTKTTRKRNAARLPQMNDTEAKRQLFAAAGTRVHFAPTPAPAAGGTASTTTASAAAAAGGTTTAAAGGTTTAATTTGAAGATTTGATTAGTPMTGAPAAATTASNPMTGTPMTGATAAATTPPAGAPPAGAHTVTPDGGAAAAFTGTYAGAGAHGAPPGNVHAGTTAGTAGVQYSTYNSSGMPPAPPTWTPGQPISPPPGYSGQPGWNSGQTGWNHPPPPTPPPNGPPPQPGWRYHYG